MYFGRLIAVMCLAGSALAQTPVISSGGVMNGASFRPSAASGGGIAAGAIVSIFGTDLAKGTAGATSLPLPTALNGTSVTIGGRNAPLFYVSAGQINAQVPWATSAGTQQVVVTANGVRSAAVNVTVQTASPGIFTQLSTGHGSGVIQSFFSQGFTPLNTLTTAVAPGGILIIYATGLGAVPVPPADGAAGNSQNVQNTVTVRIGSQVVNADSATLSAGFVGLYQVNVKVPVTTPEGCAVPVQVLVAGQVSNGVTVSVAKNKDCTALASESTPAPFSTTGQIFLSRAGGADSLLAGFIRYVAVAADPNLAPPGDGGCLVDIAASTSQFSSLGSATLNAGPLTYTPPSGDAQTLNRDLTLGGGLYGAQILIAPGVHTVRGAGGTNVAIGAFTAAINLPSQFSGAANISGGTISQAQGFTPTWNACPDPNGKVVVAISSQGSNGVVGSAVCSAACVDRMLALDSTVLSQLPAGSASVDLTYFATPVRFSATGLNAGFLVFSDKTSLSKLSLVP